MNPAAPGALRARIGELVRRRRASPASAPGEARPPAPPLRARARRESGAIPDGRPWRDARGGEVHVIERRRSAIEPPRADWGVLAEPGPDEPALATLAALGLESVLFLDLETCGLASNPVFLAGTMHWNGEDFVVRQYFARDYAGEPALLAAVAELARGFAALVTFNGKSYDAPFLRARALVHAVPLELPARHLDLLHLARRRWRDELPDCRLQTLERHVCGRRRTGDVPGEQVPAIYHAWVRDGDARALAPVFHHNLLDVVTMADVLQALCAPRATRAVGAGRAGRVGRAH